MMKHPIQLALVMRITTLALCSSLVSCSHSVVEDATETLDTSKSHIYRADHFMDKSGFPHIKIWIHVEGSEFYSESSDAETSDVIGYYGGCEKRGSVLKLKHSDYWLDFEVDLDTKPKSYDEAKAGELIFVDDSSLFGERIKIFGVKQRLHTLKDYSADSPRVVVDALTVFYYSPLRGILGWGVFSESLTKEEQVMAWLQGDKGMCAGALDKE